MSSDVISSMSYRPADAVTKGVARRLLTVAAAGCLMLGSLMAVTTPANAQSLKKLTFAWPGTMSITFAPFAFAMDLGFFKEEGIDVDLITLPGGGVILPQIESGAVFTSDIGLDPLVIARAPGKGNFNVTFAYNANRDSIWTITVLDGSPITNLKQLEGKTIGVGALSYGSLPVTKAMLIKLGVDINKVTFLPVGTGVPALEALRRGQIDALNLYDITDMTLRQQGTAIRNLPYPAEFVGITSHSMPFSNKDIATRPDLVAGFGRAVAKGTVACLANVSGCMEAYWKFNPSSRVSGGDDVARQRQLLEGRLVHMSYFAAGSDKKWGGFDDRDAKSSIASLFAAGVIPSGDVDPASITTNRFVDEFNRFDEAAVKAKALSYKP